MAGRYFTADVVEMKRLGRQLKRGGARMAKYAMSEFLNSLVFRMRRHYITYMPTVMTVRNQAFMRKSFRASRARPSMLSASVYSQALDRSSGWTEQQRGTKADRHVATLRARGGNRQRSMRRGARLRAGRILHINRTPGGSKRQKFARLVKGARMKGRGTVFIAGGVPVKNGLLPWGLWQVGNLSKGNPDHPEYRKIHMLQRFNDPPGQQPRRMDWAGKGAEYGLKKEDLPSMWNQAFNKMWSQSR